MACLSVQLCQRKHQLPVFEREEPCLHVEPAGEAVQTAIRADNAMTGDDERHRVVGEGRAYRLGHARPTTNLSSNPTIGARLAIKDACRNGPYREFEGGMASQVEVYRKFPALAVQVGLDLASDVQKERVIPSEFCIWIVQAKLLVCRFLVR